MTRTLSQSLAMLLMPIALVGCSLLQGSSKTPGSQASAELAPVYGELRTVAQLPIRPGNVAVSEGGRVFSTIHPMDGEHDVQLIEITGTHSYRAWPSAEFQTRNGDYGDDTIDSPLGTYRDDQGGLWITDMGTHLGKTRIWGFDIATGDLIRKVTLPSDVAPKGSFIQDLVVDRARGYAYMADIANPGLITVNLATQEASRFGNHPSVKAQPEARMVINGKAIQFGGAPANVGADPITLSADRKTVFFGAMNSFDWFSVPAETLRTTNDHDTIAKAVSRVGPKPVSDGADTDAAGRHYFTNLNENGVDVLLPSGELKAIARDQRLKWPDNVKAPVDGWLYVAVNQLHKAPPFTGGKDQGEPPYAIYKIWVGEQ